MNEAVPNLPTNNWLRARRLGIDTHDEPVIYMRADCPVCRSEGFEAHSRVEVHGAAEQRIIATLNVVHGELLETDEVGLSEAAWRKLQPEPGEALHFAHPPPVDSMSAVRGKIYGRTLSNGDFRDIIADVVAGRYSNVQVAAFLTACAGEGLTESEITGLTRAMIASGNRMRWPHTVVADKHCVGGLPGNRTTMVVVPVVAALGLVMPKTSSRAITSPSGTADTMETLAPVNLSVQAMREAVESEGGCIVWGGSVHLSPADDMLIRIERALDIDSEGQLIASVLSKKAAAGSTHVVLDLPVGPTAKLRTEEAARRIGGLLENVGRAVGLDTRILYTDGAQPVGRGIGPALEARDVLAVLKGEGEAPADLRERSLRIAAAVLELAAGTEPGESLDRVTAVLDDGRAWAKFQAICEAQGGMREPGRARYRREVTAPAAGIVRELDNRLIARVAKLAGAPQDPTAGVLMHARSGDTVAAGQPLFEVRAESTGELEYALAFVDRHPGIARIGGGES